MGYIVDISHWNTISSYDALARNSDFVIMKATQGAHAVDKTYKARAAELDKRGCPHWAYSFMERSDGAAQADFLLRTAPTATGFVLDVEDYAGTLPTAAQVEAAARHIVKAGCKCVVYIMDSEFNMFGHIAAKVSREMCTNWVARYGNNTGGVSKRPVHTKNVSLHQYTSVGAMPGVAGSCDLSELWGGDKPLEWFLESEVDMNNEQNGWLATNNTMLTRKDNAGYDAIPAGHNMYGRVCRIENMFERTDNAGHKSPDGHNLYGRVNAIQEELASQRALLQNVQKQLKTITTAVQKIAAESK